MASKETTPMKEFDEDEVRLEGEKVFVVSKTRALLLVFLVVLLIILVGVLSGVFSAKQAARKAREEALARRDSPSTAPSTEPSGPKPWYQIRLPQNIRPIHYDFYLRPDLSKNTFEGNVSILVEVTSTSDYMKYILIHINEMDVTKASVSKQKGGNDPNSAAPGDEVKLRDTFENKENNYFVFELEEDLEIGKYVVQMEYKSKLLSSPLNGLYISTYKNANGVER